MIVGTKPVITPRGAGAAETGAAPANKPLPTMPAPRPPTTARRDHLLASSAGLIVRSSFDVVAPFPESGIGSAQAHTVARPGTSVRRSAAADIRPTPWSERSRA